MSKYTEQDLNIIRNLCANNMTNLSQAFEKASKKLNRTPGAISQVYYSRIVPNATKPVYALGNGTEFSINKKNQVPKKKDNKLFEMVINNLSEIEKAEMALLLFTTLKKETVAKVIAKIINK